MAAPNSFSRRCFFRTFLATGLAVPGLAHGAEEKTALEIFVEPKGWGTAAPADLQTLLLAAAGEIWRGCAGELIRPIRVYSRPDFPQTDFRRDWSGRIRIGLASEEARWAQIAFQFGHEFVHALAQHSAAARRSWHPPRHANLWFEECLCEAGSLFVLRRLAERWQTAPPEPRWRAAAATFAEFASQRLARDDHQRPAEQPFAEWFSRNEAALRENHTLRARNVIVARQLLPLIEAEPGGWKAACYLNLGKRQHGKSLGQYFAEWQRASPPAQRPFVARVAAVFALPAADPGR